MRGRQLQGLTCAGVDAAWQSETDRGATMDGGMEGCCSKVGTVQRGMRSVAGVEVMEQSPALIRIGACRQNVVVNLREGEANRSHVHRGRGVGAGRVVSVIEVALQKMVVHGREIWVPHGVHGVT